MVQLVSLAIRTLHVLAVAVLVGGTLALWYGYRSSVLATLQPARTYEWLFWAALGVLVLTGVGNLGALGAPGPATDWGRTLLAKLLLVLAVVLGSAVRTLAVVRTGDWRVGRPGETDARPFGRAYGVTAGALLVLVVLAEVLAHG